MQFEQELKRLNLAQRLAVETIEGPVMVIAGPGTGKTQILTLRIANILATTDTEPENILAITFTESGVAAMRKRLASIIGAPAYRVCITTFHAFCNSIIQEHAESFPRVIGSTAMTEVDQVLVLQSLVTSLKLKALRPFGNPFHYLKDILNAINEMKRENVSPEKFAKIVAEEEAVYERLDESETHHQKGAHQGKKKLEYVKKEKQIAKSKELSAVYSQYQDELGKQKRYDYTDMIMEVVRALEQDKDLLYELQEQYQYVLVDEHQDTNNAQNKLLELLLSFHDNPNLFVVGDAKQAIFRFQGASLENFLYFKNLYPEAKLIELEHNYRSTQTILDSAHGVLPSPKPLQAQAQHPKKQILLAELTSPDAELYCVAKHIQERISAGAAREEIAVLYRDNKDVLGVAKMLERLEVPFVIESNQNLFEDKEVKKLLGLLYATHHLGNQELLTALLHTDFLNIDPLDAYKLVIFVTRKKNAEKGRRLGLYDVLRSEKLLSAAGVGDPKPFLELYAKLAGWRKLSEYSNVAEVFEVVVRESGLLAHILALPNAVEALAKINTLFDEAKKLLEAHPRYSLAQFVEYLDMLREHDLLVKNTRPGRVSHAVRLMTAHGSKGQEFEYVYIVNAFDGHWGNKRRIEKLKLPVGVYTLGGSLPATPDSLYKMENNSSFTKGGGRRPEDFFKDDKDDKNADERNLFYVALTRAKREIVISYAQARADGKEQLPSQFVAEIPEGLLEKMDVSGYERELSERQEIVWTGPSFAKATEGQGRVAEKEFVRELFLERGLAVTALNNYLTCPWQWFYSNLLRVPEAQNKHLLYGTAIHAALKDFHDWRQADNKKGKAEEFLIGAFENALTRLPFSERDLAETLEKGKLALAGYYEEYKKTWNSPLLSEFAVAGVHVPVSGVKDVKELRLTGKLDAVEVLANGRDVSVIDYKTGKPKSRNELMGKTKSADGNYYRQLVFYKLLLDNYPSAGKKKYEMVSGVIDFIEPNDRGKYIREEFEIADTEVEELRSLIQAKAKEILNLDFWDNRCDAQDCRYCELRSFMR
ncbi:MAG: hypothetical protein COU11_02255 [Candidatus Harrisonbacteria bacterium CG10_big_fil_rev_8_21_14_0_10_49_15]|uniref:DNA 3'-5' helicase n=1 Tax=Candidatus Harrisonbacteria bacterium CG10_big_fil_rev_8_21_14_0_10_49_15 TaxID=1974587 RepID=A0A2H0UKW9_9BACT|nr:MAG: hypothetical protein COU11_02255 [Candidatus Harrisonbacteria bacterium CG10_big_fil_rev_8_21_14_0_10_49_15]